MLSGMVRSWLGLAVQATARYRVFDPPVFTTFEVNNNGSGTSDPHTSYLLRKIPVNQDDIRSKDLRA